MLHTVDLPISELQSFLLEVALEVPVFVWGPPGIGKSTIINSFSREADLETVILNGSQLAPEDLIGIPQIDLTIPTRPVSRFIPPSNIVRDIPYCLFLDELNLSSSEVLKAFYSLITEKRVGEYYLPKDSIIIGAGNRSSDAALVRKMPSTLINRMIHVHVKASHKDWLIWAKNNNINQQIIDFITACPSALFTNEVPTREEAFSTPRSWEYVSIVFDKVKNNPKFLEVVLKGALREQDANAFLQFLKKQQNGLNVEKILEGKQDWPNDIELLSFMVISAREYLLKILPKDNNKLSSNIKKSLHNIKSAIKNLSYINAELASLFSVENEAGQRLPNWFIIELAK